MGNTPHSKPNHKLGVPIVGKIESFSSKSSSERGLVLGCYILFPDNTIEDTYAKLFHILIVTPLGIEMYCLLTGEKRYHSYVPPKSTSIVASIFSKESMSNTQVITAESNGAFALIDAFSLKVTKRIGISHSLPSLNATKNVIFTMISPAPEVLYVGYVSGVVKVWHTSVSSPQYTFGKEFELPAVRCLCYSNKHRFLIVGHEGNYENQHGRFIKLDTNSLRIYTPNASEEENNALLLEGFFGSCFSIGTIERCNLVVALSSEDCGVYLWDIQTRELVMKFNVPQIGTSSQILTQVLVLEMPCNNFLVFGLSDGNVLISEITDNDGKFLWTALKSISILNEGNHAVEYLNYVQKIDTLVIGNTFSTANFISNIFEEGLGIRLSVHEELRLDEEI